MYVDERGCITFIGIYVDDLFLMGERHQIDMLKKKLKEEYEMTDMGSVQEALGVEFDRLQDGSMMIHQSTYINKILKRFLPMESKSKEMNIPIGANDKFEKTKEDEETTDQSYSALLGSLMYLSIWTRPDIALALSTFARFSVKPSQRHWKGLLRVLRYVSKTKNWGLRYRRCDNAELIGYSDAAYQYDVDDLKSQTGYLFKYGECLISWKSKKQSTTALSSTDAEYQAISDAMREAIWLRRFKMVDGLSEDELESVRIYEDNMGVEAMVKNPVHHSRTKHILVKYHYARECVEKGWIKVDWINTKEMTADMLTKGLWQPMFLKHRREMGMDDYGALERYKDN